MFNHVSDFSRQSDVRQIGGQIGIGNIARLIMACGIIQTMRVWKRRRQNRNRPEGGVPSNGSAIAGRHGRDNMRASLDEKGYSRKGECEDEV